ncbi:MAG: hypothetical protein KC425_07475 [Anaerolineales bacterium]|nr:hypothetical protein [Anaerolineales bacterium]
MFRKAVPLAMTLGATAVLLLLLRFSAAAAGPRMAAQPAAPTAVSAPATAPLTATLTCTGTNLLQNPGFEGPYTAYQYPPPGHPDCGGTDCERAQMPAGWHPRWLPDGAEPWIIMPEYTASTPDQVNPDRVRSGEKSLHYFSFFTRHESAVHQQVAVEPGSVYCFSAWGHAWSDRISDNFYSAPHDGRPNDDGELFQKVGIDPTGGTDWQAASVIWGPARQQYDFFGEFVVTATAQAPTITVFIWSRAEVPVKHNDVYWDDALLVLSETIPALAVFPLAIGAIGTPAQPATVTQRVAIDLTAGYTWTAVLSPTGSLTPTLSAAAGPAGAGLTVTLRTAGLLTGTYTTTLHISAGPGVVGSPASIPITAYVVAEVRQVYLPIIRGSSQ